MDKNEVIKQTKEHIENVRKMINKIAIRIGNSDFCVNFNNLLHNKL